MAEGWHCTATTASKAKFCIYITIHTKQMVMPLICISWVPITNLDQNTSNPQDFVVLFHLSSQIPGFCLKFSCNYFLPNPSELTT